MSFGEIRAELEIATDPVRGLPTVAHATAWEAAVQPGVDESLGVLDSALNNMSKAIEQIQGPTEVMRGIAESAQAEYIRILPANQPVLTHGVFYPNRAP